MSSKMDMSLDDIIKQDREQFRFPRHGSRSGGGKSQNGGKVRRVHHGTRHQPYPKVKPAGMPPRKSAEKAHGCENRSERPHVNNQKPRGQKRFPKAWIKRNTAVSDRRRYSDRKTGVAARQTYNGRNNQTDTAESLDKELDDYMKQRPQKSMGAQRQNRKSASSVTMEQLDRELDNYMNMCVET